MIVAMPLRVKGGHVAVMVVSLRKLPNAEGLHFSAFHCYCSGNTHHTTRSLASMQLPAVLSKTVSIENTS